ncbi:MAG: hypothetical protein WD020_03225, partial [Acidimicrobiia bacterium]
MRLVRFFLFFILLLLLALPGAGQSDDRIVEFVDLSGILDDRMIGFAIDSISAAAQRGDTEVVILQIDSPGVVG